MKAKNDKGGILSRITRQALTLWRYCTTGVWSDTRRNWRVNLIKTLNLSARSFLDRGLQSQAAAMTFKTVLAIVPALALMFAIGKGFGIQNILKSQLFSYLPLQTDVLEETFTFVEGYLKTSREGLFVGIGVAFLLYTLISLLGSVEDSFNLIWGIKRGRTLGRKITDYTAILLLLPVLLICSSGITVYMSSMVQSALPFEFLTPVKTFVVDFVGILLLWLFFAGTYMLVPNTHVKFKNAFIAGVIAGTAFYIVQWLFVSGQIYVTRYNAIYGSFAFLPLLLLWLQMVWLITLSGGVLCYASQSIYEFSFSNEIASISPGYRCKIMVGIMLIAVKRRELGQKPLDDGNISSMFGLPISLVTKSVNDLVDIGLLDRVIVNDGDGEGTTRGVAPALDSDVITLGLVMERINNEGTQGFIPDFDVRFKMVNEAIDRIERIMQENASTVKLRDLSYT